MFTANGIAGSPPTLFQTYLTRAIPFRRRQSSSASILHSRSNSTPATSIATSPTSPASPLSPGKDFFGNYSRTASNAYDFQTCTPASSRHGSNDSSYPASLPNPDMAYLNGHTSHMSCSCCHADLALTSQIISKGFTGRHGRAFLVAPPLPSDIGGSTSLPNTNTHKPVPRHLVTGMHTVADLSCAICGSILGWKYVSAEEETQRYKVGKFILETRRTNVGACWEHDGADDEANDGMHDWAMVRWHDRRKSSGDSGISGTERIISGFGGGSGRGYKECLDAEDEITFDSEDEDECEDLFSGIWSPALAVRRRSRRASMMR